jgi:hypothetical protein
MTAGIRQRRLIACDEMLGEDQNAPTARTVIITLSVKLQLTLAYCLFLRTFALSSLQVAHPLTQLRMSREQGDDGPLPVTHSQVTGSDDQSFAAS